MTVLDTLDGVKAALQVSLKWIDGDSTLNEHADSVHVIQSINALKTSIERSILILDGLEARYSNKSDK